MIVNYYTVYIMILTDPVTIQFFLGTNLAVRTEIKQIKNDLTRNKTI